MSELIAKKVITLNATTAVATTDAVGWLETMSDVCQAGLNLHEDAMVAILNSPTRMSVALGFLIPLFMLVLYGMSRVGLF